MTTLAAARRTSVRTDAAGAVVVGGDYQGLGIARSLGRAGVPVVVLDDEVSISRVSRYVDRFVRVADLLDPDATMAALRGLVPSLAGQRWVLFPTREETVAVVARHREELSRHFRVPTPGFEVVRTAWDKRETYRCAAERGIPRLMIEGGTMIANSTCDAKIAKYTPRIGPGCVNSTWPT